VRAVPLAGIAGGSAFLVQGELQVYACPIGGAFFDELCFLVTRF
jgi:hypothetical protein